MIRTTESVAVIGGLCISKKTLMYLSSLTGKIQHWASSTKNTIENTNKPKVPGKFKRGFAASAQLKVLAYRFLIWLIGCLENKMTMVLGISYLGCWAGQSQVLKSPKGERPNIYYGCNRKVNGLSLGLSASWRLSFWIKRDAKTGFITKATKRAQNDD